VSFSAVLTIYTHSAYKVAGRVERTSSEQLYWPTLGYSLFPLPTEHGMVAQVIVPLGPQEIFVYTLLTTGILPLITALLRVAVGFLSEYFFRKVNSQDN
jgi:hypothetical protein